MDGETNAGRVPTTAHSPDSFEFSLWLEQTLASRKTGESAVVPCGSCTACCTSSYFVHVRPQEPALSYIPEQLLFDAPGLPGHKVMGFDEKGRCPMFLAGGCSIYQWRPEACRLYDCRVHAATGIEADRPLIADRASQWRLEDANGGLRRLREFAEFMVRNLPVFPAGLLPQNAPQLAYVVLGLFSRGAPLNVEKIVSMIRGDQPGRSA